MSFDHNFYQKIAVGVLCSVGGMLVTAFTVGRSAVTRDDLQRDMPQLIAQYSPYTADAKDIADQLRQLKDEVESERADDAQHYQHIEDQISQLQIDATRLAAKEQGR